ncbi:hypothetical protein [Paenibacillus graminis]|uniref:hypothetical protein n=1 Tax=Paenibacillus graminis TaxID=189425 RepID=UPI002DB728E2|nr:hypothetical protein [Paenibacillus graminis]MEC0168617.1 hypothetical protein [Paenibacillus graminis]
MDQAGSMENGSSALFQTLVNGIIMFVNINPAGKEYAKQIQGTIAVQIGEECKGFSFADGTVVIHTREELTRPIASIFFKDADTAISIFSGAADINWCAYKETFAIKGYLLALAIFNEILAETLKLTR